jgi:hypothetical protein
MNKLNYLNIKWLQNLFKIFMVFKVLYYKKLHITFYVSDFVSFYSFKNKSFIFQAFTG